MKLEPFWADILAKSATIDERLSGSYIRHSDEIDPAVKDGLAEERLNTWCEFSAGGDWEQFERRLARDGLIVDEVAPLLGAIKFRDEEEPPEWLHSARWIYEAMMSGDASEADACPGEFIKTIPFADFFWPVVVEARNRVEDFSTERLSNSARQDLCRILIVRMAKVYQETLYESFDSFRKAVGVKPEEASGSELYDAFKSALRNGPLANLITNRPIMIRLIATIVDQWNIVMTEFIQRLGRDISGFSDHFPAFGVFGGLQRVTAIKGGISDAHNHGRAVLILEMESGGKLVYKPREIGAESAWKVLSDWLEKSGSDIRLDAARTWCRPGYGWMEHIDHAPDLSAKQAPDFFRAAGHLMSVLYCLKGSDMHHENYVVSNARPVAIDLETLFQPELRHLAGPESGLHAKELAKHQFDNGIIAVGLLPQRQKIAGHWVSDGGLAVAKVISVSAKRFRNINQGNMVAEAETIDQTLVGMDVTIDGAPTDVADYVTDIVKGFREGVMFMVANKDKLLASDGPLAAFDDVCIRHVLRPTAYYQEIESAVYVPQNQQDGFVWSLNFERMARRARWDLDNYPGWGILACERRALARMDVPLFVGRTDRDGVWADDAPITNGFTAPAVLPRMGQRLDALAAGLDCDCAIIRQALLALRPTDLPARRSWPRTPKTKDIEKLARETALSIASFVADHAITNDGSAAWMTVDVTPDGEGLQVMVMEESLYGGNAGLGLFFANCHSVDPVGKWRDMAFSALAAPRVSAGTSGSIGGFDGLGGIIYVLCRCSELLEAPELLDEALVLSAQIDERMVEADNILDVIGGVAGTILALLVLYQQTWDQAVLDRAVLCGRHLPNDPADWKGVSDRSLAGMSHGAAGMTYALLKLYKLTANQEFLTLAKQGLEYERSLFDPVGHGWPDLRGEQPGRDPVQWCHGAVGVGLARMALLDVLDDQTIRSEIETAVSAALSAQDGGRDNLCCGHAGRFSMLNYAHRLGLLSGESEQAYLQHLSAWIGRLVERKELGMMASDRAFQTGLMQGLPGIGLALLEISSPDQLKPVLSLA